MASSFTTNGVESTSRPAFEATASHSAEDGNNEQMFATNNGYSVTERFDQGSDFAPATGNFTAPITGRYFFSWCVRYNSLPDESYIHIGPQASNVGRTSWQILSDGSLPRAYHYMSGSTITDMDASDTIYISFYMAGSGTVAIEGQSTFAGCLIC